ncbi:hypothetical protein FXF51_28130 [Nonomuraea sp. PA05]|uniref:hypothetical protein n=1 Tax=Nonomuraea sp. PA05 TaxID=2604466 RepID=UPI0011DAC307|nr:hypothetical protein [Nonomuraea sp. PA05]TYB61336.1 hypothetical protein FXF51_28130 [Nonomuraea sp. PA05]
MNTQRSSPASRAPQPVIVIVLVLVIGFHAGYSPGQLREIVSIVLVALIALVAARAARLQAAD